jgi:hypothetical protein
MHSSIKKGHKSLDDVSSNPGLLALGRGSVDSAENDFTDDDVDLGEGSFDMSTGLVQRSSRSSMSPKMQYRYTNADNDLLCSDESWSLSELYE